MPEQQTKTPAALVFGPGRVPNLSQNGTPMLYSTLERSGSIADYVSLSKRFLRKVEPFAGLPALMNKPVAEGPDLCHTNGMRLSCTPSTRYST